MKRTTIIIALLSFIGFSYGFIQTPMSMVCVTPNETASNQWVEYLKTNYPAISDSAGLIIISSRYNDRGSNVPSFITYWHGTVLYPGDTMRTPWAGFNGNIRISTKEEVIESLTTSIGRDKTPFSTWIEYFTDDSVYVKITSDDPTCDSLFHRVYLLILENDVTFYSSTTPYNWVLRNIFPFAMGDIFEPVAGDTITYAIHYKTGNYWNLHRCRFALFIDRPGSYDVRQFAFGPVPLLDYKFDVRELDPSSALAEPGSLQTFRNEIINNGLLLDTIRITYEVDMPPGWVFEVCLDSTIRFSSDTSIYLDSENRETVWVRITPDSTSGAFGSVVLIYTSTNTADTFETNFFVTNGGHVLVFDQSSYYYGSPEYYTDVLDSLGEQFTYFRSSYGSINASTLRSFDIVIWYIGTSSVRISYGTAEAFANFLDNGGKLFISSQSNTYNMSEAGRYPTYYRHLEFLESYLRCSSNRYSVWNSSNSKDLYGVPLDPITNDLHLDLNDPAPYDSEDGDIITPVAGGIPILYYDAERTKCAGLRWTGEGYAGNPFEVVVFGLDFACIENFENRKSLMINILAWLDSASYIQETPNKTPDRLSLEVIPNPFNISCEISYTSDGDAYLAFHDLSGRLLEEVSVSGTGKYIWKADNFSSGIYFVRLIQKNRSLDKKIILLK